MMLDYEFLPNDRQIMLDILERVKRIEKKLEVSEHIESEKKRPVTTEEIRTPLILMGLREKLIKASAEYPNTELRIEASGAFISYLKISYIMKKHPNAARMMKDEDVHMELFGFPLVQVDDVDRYRIVVIPDDLKGSVLCKTST